MTRLQSELHRLYLPSPSGEEPTVGLVRAAVLAIARPADWDALAKVWRGVQADLGLPAPAIAVAGAAGYQLWFSLLEPTPAAQAHAFLEALRRRYLGDVVTARVGLLLQAQPVPALVADSGNWSAFVAPDLAPVFGDEPWLDTPPNIDGQADLLQRLESIKSGDFQAALARLGAVAVSAGAPSHTSSEQTSASLDPRRFLLQVMNDASVDLGLRIEAAKALLPGFKGPGQG